LFNVIVSRDRCVRIARVIVCIAYVPNAIIELVPRRENIAVKRIPSEEVDLEVN
jgi:hypothetical protein